MKLSLTCFLTLWVTSAWSQFNETFDDCDASVYYADLPVDVSNWDRDLLQNLIYLTHRRVVSLTNSLAPGSDDVWGALMDVDAGEEPGTIHLAFTNEEIPQIPFGERGWVRDHMFPLSRGIGQSGPDWTDIHNIRAVTSLGKTVQGDRYFGECGVLTQPETCITPAEGGAEDTCVCNRIYEPPADMKGDIARALMYMDLRYDGNEPLTLDLRLTDCPFQAERDMAYLSQMLTWHAEDPPDEREIVRNQKVCQNWQGNRNPFVDFPELATLLWDDPEPLPAIGERMIYEVCEALPTLAPTFTANQCDMYEDGDFTIWMLNSDDPTALGMYSFVPLSEGFELFVTDNPWNGESFLEQEGAETYDGTLKFTVPVGGMPGGSLFGYGDEQFPRVTSFSMVQGNFTPAVGTGEALFVYCYSASGEQRAITVFANGDHLLAEPGLSFYNESQSALPEYLTEKGIITLPHFDNLLYVGPQADDLNSNVEQLKVAVRDPSNWAGSNDYRYGFDSSGCRRLGSGNMFWMLTTLTMTILLGFAGSSSDGVGGSMLSSLLLLDF